MRKTLITALLIAAPAALGEGDVELTNSFGNQQALRAGTVLFVDVLAPDGPTREGIRWQGDGTVTVTDPEGAVLATLSTGQETLCRDGLPGAYEVVVGSDQTVTSSWDVSVTNQTTPGGRLWAYQWQFNNASYADDRSTYGSFYALVPGGAPGTNATIELSLNGLSGYVWDLSANRLGVDGLNAGRSVPSSGNTLTPEYPIYLNTPSRSTFDALTPTISGLSFSGAAASPVYAEGDLSACNEFISGETGGTFTFTTNVEATYHILCDLNGDAVFDPTAGADLFLVGATVADVNEVAWNGMNGAAQVPPGSYDCRVRVNVGEFHYVGRDIETSFEGLRMYVVNANGTRTRLRSFWNDTAVQASAQSMPNGQLGLASSSVSGVDPLAYGTTAQANVNARAWGNFNSTGKGNNAFLDTYVVPEAAESVSIDVVSATRVADADGDGLSDFSERCFIGTDPGDADTDNDGTPDGVTFNENDEVDVVTLFYEDMLGSGTNDWDYNDFVVDARTSFSVDASQQVSRLDIEYQPLARGAGYYHQFKQHIPEVSGGWTATVTVEGRAPVVTTGTGAVEVTIYEDTRDAMPPAVTGDYANTEEGPEWQPGVNATLRVDLNDPAANPRSAFADDAPFDAYLELPYIGTADKTVRLPAYGGQVEVTSRIPGLGGIALPFVIRSRSAQEIHWACEGYPVWSQFPTFISYATGGIGAATSPQIFDRPTNKSAAWRAARTQSDPSICGAAP
jgi:hypothetical protein